MKSELTILRISSTLITFSLFANVTNAAPVIHAQWDEGGQQQPEEGIHYNVYTDSPASPEFPDVELVTGRLDWRIWSVDTSNPDDLGDIGVISSPHAEDFAVRISNPSHPFLEGARNIKAIMLEPTNSSNYSRINGGSFGLVDGLVLKANSSGDGGDIVGQTSVLTESADFIIHRMTGNLWISGGSGYSGSIVVDELSADLSVGHLLAGGSIEVWTTSGITAAIRTVHPTAGSITVGGIDDGLFFFNSGGVTQTGELNFGEFLGTAIIEIAQSGADVEGSVRFDLGLPNDVYVTFGAPTFGGGDLTPTGVIEVNYDLAGTLELFGSVYGTISVQDQWVPEGDLYPITGTLKIHDELDGELCALNVSPLQPLPPNVTIGSFGSNASICGVSNDCTSSVSAAQTPTPSQEAVAKNRYISFVPGNSGTDAAIRVRLAELTSTFSTFDGQYRWVGPPAQYPEVGGGTFMAAPLLCDPYYTNWGSVGTLHVYGADIVPGATYEVQLVHEDCNERLAFETNYSTSWSVTNQKWGDIVEPFGGTSQPSFADVSAVLSSFRGEQAAPIKSRAQLTPNVPNPGAPVNFANVAAVLDAFRGVPYPFSGPEPCPSLFECGPGDCESDDDCPAADQCDGSTGNCVDWAYRCTP
jgi:hypothetical protein